jgi:hypothetical protein
VLDSPKASRYYHLLLSRFVSGFAYSKLGGVARLYLNLLIHFSAGVDPVALKSAEDAIEAALFDPEPAFQGLNHIPMGVRIFQVHVERGRRCSADPFKSTFAAPEFHAALGVRVEDPQVIPHPQGPGWSSFLPRLYCQRRRGEGRGKGGGRK